MTRANIKFFGYFLWVMSDGHPSEVVPYLINMSVEKKHYEEEHGLTEDEATRLVIANETDYDNAWLHYGDSSWGGVDFASYNYVMKDEKEIIINDKVFLTQELERTHDLKKFVEKRLENDTKSRTERHI